MACLTVLVVDDVDDNRSLLKRMLQMQDYRVVEAIDGREAVELALILKLTFGHSLRGLPGLNSHGFELAAHGQAGGHKAHPRV